MAEEKVLIRPDDDFIKEVKKYGGASVKQCYQCATCSVTCALSPDDSPFPRKEMIWSQWGLKERLFADPDIWLCHQCNDCTVYCPRNAKPGDVLAAIRNYMYKSLAPPAFLGKALSDAKFLPLLILFPVVLFLALLGISGHLNIPEGEIVFKKFVPHIVVDSVFIVFSVLMLVALLVGFVRFWRYIDNLDFKGKLGDAKERGPHVKLMIKALIDTIVEFLLHKKFNECDSSKIRYWAHLGIFYGFLALFITTAIIFFSTYVLGMETPLVLYHPVKLLANLGAILLCIGCGIALYQRLSRSADKQSSNNSYYDWLFLGILSIVAITGVLTEIIRLADLAAAAYVMYFIHLVFAFFLIAYLPYSKFAHLLYRLVALVYSRYGELLKAPPEEEAATAEERATA
jgi:quinone-modifying oxidoreductase subunit QmoC